MCRVAGVRRSTAPLRIACIGRQTRSSPFGRIVVDPLLCIGCKLCTAKALMRVPGGCPWDAIDMVPLAEFEAENGALPFSESDWVTSDR